uniref:DUF6396 domain-containing protein n=2 Tax=Pseudomonas amygdali TaxID=47877 RepID=UPI0028802850
ISVSLGSPEAQYYIATLLGRIKGGAVVMEQMQRCAASQGNASAARELAGYLRVGKQYDEAVIIYQQGTKSGDFYSARRLSKAFEGPSSPEDLYYMQLKTDNERSNRYLAISKFLQKNELLGPKLLDIDSIVPLPPAKLPAWDGTFQWEKERGAKTVPNKPDDALLQRLSKEKDLDPVTGLPLEKS